MLVKKLITVGIIGGMTLTQAPYAIAAVNQVMPVNENSAVNELHGEQAKILTKSIKANTEGIKVEIELPVLTGLKNKSFMDQTNAIIYNQAMQLKTEMEQEAAELVKECKKEGWEVRQNVLQISYQVYTKGEITSLAVSEYTYTGGAHGIVNREYYNLDLEKGQVLKLPDLFKDGFDYQTLLNKEYQRNKDLQIKLKGNGFGLEEENFKPVTADRDFYLKDGNLVLCYGLYEVASYADGFVEMPVSLENLKQYLKPELKLPQFALGSRSVNDQRQGLNINMNIPVAENLKDKEFQAQLNEHINNWVNQQKEAAAKAVAGNKSSKPVELACDYSLLEGKGNLQTLVLRCYLDNGGDSTTHKTRSFNFDLNQSNLVTLDDLFKAGVDYQSRLNKEIKERIKAREEVDVNVFTGENAFKSVSGNQSFYFDYDDLVICGEQFTVKKDSNDVYLADFHIPLEELKDILK